MKFWLQKSARKSNSSASKHANRWRSKRFKDHRGRLAQPPQMGYLPTGHLRHGGRTSTSNAPWTLVEANDKNYARVKGAAHADAGALSPKLAKARTAQAGKKTKKRKAQVDTDTATGVCPKKKR